MSSGAEADPQLPPEGTSASVEQNPGAPVASAEQNPGAPAAGAEHKPGAPTAGAEQNLETSTSGAEHNPGAPNPNAEQNPGAPNPSAEQNPGAPIPGAEQNPGAPTPGPAWSRISMEAADWSMPWHRQTSLRSLPDEVPTVCHYHMHEHHHHVWDHSPPMCSPPMWQTNPWQSRFNRGHSSHHSRPWAPSWVFGQFPGGDGEGSGRFSFFGGLFFVLLMALWRGARWYMRTQHQGPPALE